MPKKKKILFHSNSSRAYTGFGKNCRNILHYLHSTGKYEIVEFGNGFSWSNPVFKSLPWKGYGSLPDDQALLQKLNSDPNLARSAGYGANMIDRVIQEEKPDVYIGAEDIWAFNGYTKRGWWNKTNCMIWTTLDSLPLLPDAVNSASDIKNYYVWASFAEKALHEAGHTHAKTLHGSVDCSKYSRFSDEQKAQLRQHHGIPQNAYIIGFVFRNQLRKSVPNLLDGFSQFLRQEPRANARLLLHTHWGEGWDIPRLLQEKNIDPSLVLTTYFCNKCSSYEIRPFSGQGLQCRACGNKSLNTTNTQHGVSESQLNEIYNLMNVYCHPFTSGGQELPIQEAKLTELITLVTDYSCGKDSCSPQSGGFPLDWAEYREPGTQFIKATTHASSIANNLKKVFNMNPSKRRKIEKKARQYVLDNYTPEIIGGKLEEIIDSLPEIDWDFDFSFKPRNPQYSPPEIEGDSEWIIDLYKNILLCDVDEHDEGHKHWMHRLKTDMNRESVLQYFKDVAQKENSENNKQDFGDLFDKTENKKALMVCNADLGAVFSCTSLLEDFSKKYKDVDLYFACPPPLFPLLDGNPFVKKVLPYLPEMEDELMMIGRNAHKGYVDYYINLSRNFLKNISVLAPQ